MIMNVSPQVVVSVEHELGDFYFLNKNSIELKDIVFVVVGLHDLLSTSENHQEGKKDETVDSPACKKNEV